MKRLSLIILIVGALVLAVYLSVRFFLQPGSGTQAPSKASEISLDMRPLLIAKLKQLVKDGSDGLYSLSLDDIQADVLQSKLVLINARLTPDSMVLSGLANARKAPDDVYLLTFPLLQIDGIGIKDVLSKKHLDLNIIFLQGPVVEVYHSKRPYNKKEDTVTLYQRLTAHLKGISVKKIEVRKGTVIHHNRSKRKKSRFNDVGLVFSNVLIDSSTQNDTSRFLFAKDATLSFKNYSMHTRDGLYTVTLGSVLISAVQRRMAIHETTVTPRFDKQQFRKKIPYTKERYRVSIPKILLRNINWWNLLNEEGLEAGTAEINNAKVGVYLDRSLPPSKKSKMGNYPHQLLMKLPLPVRIDRVHLNNAEITYEEFTPVSGKSGKITLNNIEAQVTNFTNMPGQIRRKKQAVLTGTARFQHRVPLKASIRFDLVHHKQGKFSADFYFGGFDASEMNPVSEPLGMLTIKSGHVQEVTVHIKGNNNKASGKLMLLYNDLHIVALEKNAGQPGKPNKRRLFSFIANTFVIKKANPKGKEAPRSADCYFERDVEGSFFNLVWKTTLTGVLKTVGAPVKLADKRTSD